MPPPAAARRRNRRGRAWKSPTFHVSVFNCMPEPWELWEPWERDWAELPADAISCILHKLSIVDLLLGGVAEVCRSWRRAAREEPELWRCIDMRYLPIIPQFTWDATRTNFMLSALVLSAGQCRTFLGGHLNDPQFMLLARRARSLKSLHLTGCHSIIFNGGFVNGIKKLPLLEELTLEDCYPDQEVLQLVAQVCRCLKDFRLVHRYTCYSYRIKLVDDLKAFAISRMHGLRSLTLVGDNLSNDGVSAIIDNCPHLQYLHIRDCCNISMDCNLTSKCTRITMHYNEYFPPSKEPCSTCSSPVSWFSDDGYDPDYDPDDYHDLSLYSYLGDEIDGADFQEYERILDIKRMRRYLS